MTVKLRNAGLIFDVRSFKPFSQYTHAQSPQLVKIGEINRVYFSARPLLIGGELPRTEILYVDFDSLFEEIVNYSRTPILNPSILGAYDEHGVFPFHVATVNGRLYGYISGWSRRDSVAVETSIGISESKDEGVTFQRLGDGPILTSSLHEPFLVGDPFVVWNDNRYAMFYIAGTAWKATDNEEDLQRVYKIRLAFSDDGMNWKPTLINIITDSLGSDECQALPSVAAINDNFIMSFCYREMTNFRANGKGAYQLGFARSSDLQSWTRNDSLIEIGTHESEWDAGMRCYPNINSINGKTIILYNGNDFGKLGFGLAIED
jgi:hypothetical protein